MSTSHTALSSAADERKARLAKLAGLKRKQPGSNTTIPQQPRPDQDTSLTEDQNSASTNPESTPPTDDAQSEDTLPSRPTDIHLSTRNYDPTTRQPKLGFTSSTSLLSHPTVESQSTTHLSSTLSTAQASEADLKARENSGQGGIDLLKIQPKKPNWDLKRELEERKRVWGVEGKMKNAIARIVRERIQARKREALEQRRKEGVEGKRGENEEGEGEEVGIEGAELVEGVHLREREEEEEERREREREKEEEEDEERI